MPHTPGPWREGQSGNMRVYGPDGTGGLIANVFGGRDNVRLIAAAPELLAELTAARAYIVEAIDMACDLGTSAVATLQRLESIDAVLAKAAEGRPLTEPQAKS